MRAGYITYFLEIAEEEQKHFERLTIFLKEADGPDGYLPYSDECIALEKACIKIIVFLANYLEAYIWNFAATYLGEKDAEKLEKLSTLDKWEIVPQLVFRKVIPIKANYIGTFKELIRERNKLMHHKTIDIYPYINKENPAHQFPKDLINIWERVRIKEYFALANYLVIMLEDKLS
ncbi:MAG: hypothetical protein JWR67_2630 [Mucilaginibacter sp.]|nr:hypothetical protein [Mucilaginibacter sp.]